MTWRRIAPGYREFQRRVWRRWPRRQSHERNDFDPKLVDLPGQLAEFNAGSLPPAELARKKAQLAEPFEKTR